MKKLLILLCLASTCASAQEFSAPMYNTSNTYYRTRSGKDTINLSSTKFQTIAGVSKGVVNVDTFTPQRLNGSGSISYVGAFKKASINNTVNATVNITPQKSFDGINWARVPGSVVTSVVVTSRTVDSLVSVDFPYSSGAGKLWWYGRLKIDATGDTVSAQSWYLYQKP